MEFEDPCAGCERLGPRSPGSEEFRPEGDVIIADETREGAMPGLAAMRISVGLFGVAVLASGCTIAPPAPLLSPVEVVKSYGYSETALGDNRYQVNYVAPAQRTGRSVDVRAATAAAER